MIKNSKSLKLAKKYLGKNVNVIIDRPMNSFHPKYNFKYPVNYGYIPNTKSSDGEELDVYCLNVNKPIKRISGICIAIIHRLDDDDDKLIVIPYGTNLTKKNIEKETNFQEKYFKHKIIETIIETQRPTAIIIKDNKILLIHRIKNKKEYYVFPGGHQESGENLKKTFLREMKEELNFKILKYKKIFEINDNIILNNEKRKHIFFLVQKFSGILKLGGPEISRMKKGNNNYYLTWYNKSEFKKLTPIYPRGIKKFILEKIFK